MITDHKLKNEIIEGHIKNGVTFIDPTTTFVDEEVVIASGTVIYPCVLITGRTIIGKNSTIGIFSNIDNSMVADNVNIQNSTIESSIIGHNVKIGPYAHLRPNCTIGDDVTIGNYAEIKNTVIGAGSKVSHIGYLGDAIIGENVNIGAGTIVCNYDGKHKHNTNIGSNAFIGSSTLLIAPINIGENALTGAGSVVTKDIEKDMVAYGVPAKPIHKRE